MTTLFLECALRAALIVAGTAMAVWATRIKTAAGRHAAWTVAVVAMLVLPVWSIGGPRLSLPVLRTPASPTVAAPGPQTVAAPLVDTAELREAVAAGVPPATSVVDWQTILIGLYALGACAFLARLLTGTIQAQRLRRSAVVQAGRLTSPRCVTPITVGWLSPMLILPAEWERWPKAQLDAVLTHEGAHARRRDPLVQWLALLNRAVFWFHPLAWWLERRLTALAEEACDAAVLAAGHSPQDYSQYLLDLARAVMREGRRVNVVGMAMPGSHLKPRLRRILDGMPRAPTSKVRLVSTVALAALASGAAAAATLAPRVQASPSRATAAMPKFDVVSVKPCAPDAPGQIRGGGGTPITSPGRLYLQCYPLSTMFQEAYIFFADGRGHELTAVTNVGVEGGPDWMKSDRYTIEAKTEQNAPAAVMRGPMLQAVLEDRFKLKVRRMTREMPVYELVIAKSGARVSPYTGHDCVIRDEAVWPPIALPADQSYCGDEVIRDGDRVIRAGVMTLDLLASLLNFDRPVVNKTGITAAVSFRIESAKEDAFGGGETPRASWLSALRNQLGLDLHPSKGPRDFLVIDHAERPVPNEAVAPAQSTAAPAQKFVVTSVKPCENSDPSGGRGTGGGDISSLDRMDLPCMPLDHWIETAYVEYPNGVRPADLSFLPLPIVGGPSWINFDRYKITAETTGHPSALVMRGPMLQTLLEDRFKLKLHREARQVAVHELTVAKGGLKLQRTPDGSCTDTDFSKPLPPPLPPEQSHTCTIYRHSNGSNVTVDVRGKTLPQIATYLDNLIEGPVIDKTGVTDGQKFTIHLEFVADETMPALRPGNQGDRGDTGGPAFPPLASALEKLGITYAPAKGPGQFLVIDRVERPAPDLPSPTMERLLRAGAGR